MISEWKRSAFLDIPEMVHDPRQEKMNPALISPLTATLNESTETIIYRPSWGGKSINNFILQIHYTLAHISLSPPSCLG